MYCLHQKLVCGSNESSNHCSWGSRISLTSFYRKTHALHFCEALRHYWRHHQTKVFVHSYSEIQLLDPILWTNRRAVVLHGAFLTLRIMFNTFWKHKEIILLHFGHPFQDFPFNQTSVAEFQWLGNCSSTVRENRNAANCYFCWFPAL